MREFNQFSLDTLIRSWTSQSMIRIQNAGEMYHSCFRYDEAVSVIKNFFNFTFS